MVFGGHACVSASTMQRFRRYRTLWSSSTTSLIVQAGTTNLQRSIPRVSSVVGFHAISADDEDPKSIVDRASW
jgi:hypothetical protein